MPAVEVFRPLKVNARGSSELKITNLGPESIYYDQSSSVSATKNIGTLAAAEALTISGPLPIWFICKEAEAGEKQKTAIVDFEEKQTGFDGNIGFGESQTVYAPNPGFQFLNLAQGSAAAPDTTYSPLVHVSRVLDIPEADFSGDGAPGLTTAYFVGRATEASEGQAIGVVGAAITESSHEGAHSLADAIGGYFVGKSNAGSTRTGQGIFTLGRREDEAGWATGNESVSDNETEKAGVYNAAGISDTKGVHVHAVGKQDSAVGIQITKATAEGRSFQVGYAVSSGVTESGFRDDSKSARALDIQGEHSEAAIRIAEKAGKFAFVGGSGNFVIGQSFGANNFYEGDAKGDGTFGLTQAGHVMHFGIRTGVGQRSTLRVGENIGIGQAADSFGGGKAGVVFVANAGTPPGSNPTGGGVLYAEAGALWWRGSGGTVTEVAKA